MRAIESPVVGDESDGDYHSVCVCLCVSVCEGILVCAEGVYLLICVFASAWCPWPYKGGLSGVIYLIPVYPGGLVAASASPGFCKSAHAIFHTVLLCLLVLNGFKLISFYWKEVMGIHILNS